METELIKTLIVQAPAVGVLLFLVYRQDRRLEQRETRVDRLLERLEECYRKIADCQDANTSQREVTS